MATNRACFKAFNAAFIFNVKASQGLRKSLSLAYISLLLPLTSSFFSPFSTIKHVRHRPYWSSSRHNSQELLTDFVKCLLVLPLNSCRILHRWMVLYTEKVTRFLRTFYISRLRMMIYKTGFSVSRPRQI